MKHDLHFLLVNSSSMHGTLGKFGFLNVNRPYIDRRARNSK